MVMFASGCCDVAGCPDPGTKLLNVEADFAGGGRKVRFPPIIDRMTIEVCLCPSHYDYLMRGTLRDVSFQP